MARQSQRRRVAAATSDSDKIQPSDPGTSASSTLNQAASSTSVSTSTSTSTSLPSNLAKRKQVGPTTTVKDDKTRLSDTKDDRQPLLGQAATPDEKQFSAKMAPATTWAGRNRWIILALASGGCAAFNGVFAKLTTTELTTSLSLWVANLFGLSSLASGVEVVVRCIFFGLNLAFNGVMWALFTKALTAGNSTTQVSIINTSSNFVVTAILGLAIFSESLPPLWWVGAAMLVIGNVIIGRKDEGTKRNDDEDENDAASTRSPRTRDNLGDYRSLPLSEDVDPEAKRVEDEDILDLELGDL